MLKKCCFKVIDTCLLVYHRLRILCAGYCPSFGMEIHTMGGQLSYGSLYGSLNLLVSRAVGENGFLGGKRLKKHFDGLCRGVQVGIVQYHVDDLPHHPARQCNCVFLCLKYSSYSPAWLFTRIAYLCRQWKHKDECTCIYLFWGNWSRHYAVQRWHQTLCLAHFTLQCAWTVLASYPGRTRLELYYQFPLLLVPNT